MPRTLNCAVSPPYMGAESGPAREPLASSRRNGTSGLQSEAPLTPNMAMTCQGIHRGISLTDGGDGPAVPQRISRMGAMAA